MDDDRLREASEWRQRLPARLAELDREEARRSAMTRFVVLVAVGVLVLELFLAYQWLGLAAMLSLVCLVGGFFLFCSAGLTLMASHMAQSGSYPGDPNSADEIRNRRIDRALALSVIVAIAVIAISLLSFVASI